MEPQDAIARRRRPPATASRPSALTRLVRGEDAPRWNAAWAALIIVFVVAWSVGNWLLPALAVQPKSGLHFFAENALSPEPLEQQRYLLCIAAALAVVPLALLLATRRAWAGALRFAPAVGQLGILATIVAALGRDHELLSRNLPLASFVGSIAVLVVAASTVNLARGPLRSKLRALDGWLRTRPGELAAFALAFLMAAGIASACLYTDSNVTLSPAQTWAHMPFTFEDVYAVTLGRTPLVDYTPQYSTLLSWLAAPILLLHAPSIGIFTALMASVTTIALVSLYLALRMVTGSPTPALPLFLPILGLGFLPAVSAPNGQTHTTATYFAAMPLRYAAPLVLLMVTVWAAGQPARRRRVVAVGAVSAGAFLMNPEFGVFAAAAAMLATLLANRAPGPWRLRALSVRLLDLAVGAVAVAALFALATLIRSGQLPEPLELVYFNRQFAAAGFAMVPIDHLLGLDALVFATLAAATITGMGLALFGTVRPGVEGRRSAVFLIYSGFFGFGAFAYFVGRSLPDVLSATYLAWGMALAALAWEAIRRYQAGGATWRVIAPAATAIVAFALIAGTAGADRLGYVFAQPGRILSDATNAPYLRMIDGVHATRDCLAPGSNTMIFAALPDRIAHDAGVHNWLPFNDPLSIVTQEQADEVFDEIRARNIQTVVVQNVLPEIIAELRQHGFERRANVPNPNFTPSPFISWGPTTQIFAQRDAPAGTVRCGDQPR